jgi:hypothetical protein
MTNNPYEARAIPGGSRATMSVSLNVVTTRETSPSLMVGVVLPKFVPVMWRDASASSGTACVMTGGSKS